MGSKLRIGQGIDIHPLVKGRALILGGVNIPHDSGLAGHSDADCLLHSLIDALLGAAGKGDIGTRFPPSEEKWRGASSLELLRMVWSELSGQGWQVVNCDITVLAELPKLAPHIPTMKQRIGEVLGLAVECIGIKATTTERLGFVGRKEGMLAQSVVLLEHDR